MSIPQVHFSRTLDSLRHKGFYAISAMSQLLHVMQLLHATTATLQRSLQHRRDYMQEMRTKKCSTASKGLAVRMTNFRCCRRCQQQKTIACRDNASLRGRRPPTITESLTTLGTTFSVDLHTTCLARSDLRACPQAAFFVPHFVIPHIMSTGRIFGLWFSYLHTTCNGSSAPPPQP